MNLLAVSVKIRGTAPYAATVNGYAAILICVLCGSTSCPLYLLYVKYSRHCQSRSGEDWSKSGRRVVGQEFRHRPIRARITCLGAQDATAFHVHEVCYTTHN